MRRCSAAAAILVSLAAPASSQPTWQDGARTILANHCVGCHRAGGAAPFALTSYDQARAWSRSMARQIETGSMPPWHADSPAGYFSNDRRPPERPTRTTSCWTGSRLAVHAGTDRRRAAIEAESDRRLADRHARPDLQPRTDRDRRRGRDPLHLRAGRSRLRGRRMDPVGRGPPRQSGGGASHHRRLPRSTGASAGRRRRRPHGRQPRQLCSRRRTAHPSDRSRQKNSGAERSRSSNCTTPPPGSLRPIDRASVSCSRRHLPAASREPASSRRRSSTSRPAAPSIR